jgi:hypothetical protein
MFEGCKINITYCAVENKYDVVLYNSTEYWKTCIKTLDCSNIKQMEKIRSIKSKKALILGKCTYLDTTETYVSGIGKTNSIRSFHHEDKTTIKVIIPKPEDIIISKNCSETNNKKD